MKALKEKKESWVKRRAKGVQTGTWKTLEDAVRDNEGFKTVIKLEMASCV